MTKYIFNIFFLVGIEQQFFVQTTPPPTQTDVIINDNGCGYGFTIDGCTFLET